MRNACWMLRPSSFRFGKMTCELCKSRVPKRHARRGQDA
jgi:hypothetical protein